MTTTDSGNEEPDDAARSVEPANDGTSAEREADHERAPARRAVKVYALMVCELTSDGDYGDRVHGIYATRPLAEAEWTRQEADDRAWIAERTAAKEYRGQRWAYTINEHEVSGSPSPSGLRPPVAPEGISDEMMRTLRLMRGGVEHDPQSKTVIMCGDTFIALMRLVDPPTAAPAPIEGEMPDGPQG